jgi:hypothetical protein
MFISFEGVFFKIIIIIIILTNKTEMNVINENSFYYYLFSDYLKVRKRRLSTTSAVLFKKARAEF